MGKKTASTTATAPKEEKKSNAPIPPPKVAISWLEKAKTAPKPKPPTPEPEVVAAPAAETNGNGAPAAPVAAAKPKQAAPPKVEDLPSLGGGAAATEAAPAPAPGAWGKKFDPKASKPKEEPKAAEAAPTAEAEPEAAAEPVPEPTNFKIVEAKKKKEKKGKHVGSAKAEVVEEPVVEEAEEEPAAEEVAEEEVAAPEEEEEPVDAKQESEEPLNRSTDEPNVVEAAATPDAAPIAPPKQQQQVRAAPPAITDWSATNWAGSGEPEEEEADFNAIAPVRPAAGPLASQLPHSDANAWIFDAEGPKLAFPANMCQNSYVRFSAPPADFFRAKTPPMSPGAINRREQDFEADVARVEAQRVELNHIKANLERENKTLNDQRLRLKQDQQHIDHEKSKLRQEQENLKRERNKFAQEQQAAQEQAHRQPAPVSSSHHDGGNFNAQRRPHNQQQSHQGYPNHHPGQHQEDWQGNAYGYDQHGYDQHYEQGGAYPQQQRYNEHYGGGYGNDFNGMPAPRGGRGGGYQPSVQVGYPGGPRGGRGRGGPARTFNQGGAPPQGGQMRQPMPQGGMPPQQRAPQPQTTSWADDAVPGHW